MAGDRLVYNHDGINDGAEAIDVFLRQMDTTLDEVETALKPLEGEAWAGSVAQEAYFEKKEMWRNAALAIAEQLLKLKIALGQSSAGMQDTDIRAAKMFG